MKGMMWVGALAMGVFAAQSADAAPPQRRFPAPDAARAERPWSRVHRPRRLQLAAMDLAGAAGEPIPLRISAPAPAAAAASGAVLLIRNLPRQTLLSTGFDLGGGRWIVLANRIKDTRLVVSAAAPSRRFALEAALLGRDLRAEPAAPVEFTVRISLTAKTAAN